MDTGWLKTVDQYHAENTQFIYASVVAALVADPTPNATRRFQSVEVAFFRRFYDASPAAVQAQVQQLVREGRLVFVGGGWCMHDEGNPTFGAMVDNMELGHSWINATFGPSALPRVAFQVDPSGLSSLSPTLFKAMGLEALVIGRVDTRWKEALKANQTMQFMWHGSSSLPAAQSALWTHVLNVGYSSPHGFAFGNHGAPGTRVPWSVEPQGGYQPWSDPPVLASAASALTPANAAQRAQEIAGAVNAKAGFYRTREVLLLMGSDFTYQNAVLEFANLDRLIEAVNANATDLGMSMQYSTLNDWYDAVQTAAASGGIDWPTVSQDFFPYRRDNSSTYRTGLYTSRPSMKGGVRQADAVLRVAETLHALVGANTTDAGEEGRLGSSIVGKGEGALPHLQQLRRASAVSEHHDAIVGTMLPAVFDDYIARLDAGRAAVTPSIASMLAELGAGTSAPRASPRRLAHVNDEEVTVTVYNSLGMERHAVVSLPVTAAAAYGAAPGAGPTTDCSNVTVLGPDGTPVTAQLDPVMSNVTGAPVTPAACILRVAVAIPALGFVRLTVLPGTPSPLTHMAAVLPCLTHRRVAGLQPGSLRVDRVLDRAATSGAPPLAACTIGNALVTASFDPQSGLLESIASHADSEVVEVAQDIVAYKSQDVQTDEAADAYAFVPSGPATPVRSQGPALSSQPVHLVLLRGPLVETAVQVFMPGFVSQTLSVATDDASLPDADAQLIWTTLHVSMDVPQLLNHDLVSRYNTSLATAGAFTSDANGLQVRHRLYEAQVPSGDPIAGNYYPCPGRASIQQAGASGPQLTLIGDRARGVSSQGNGSLEHMVHRRVNVTTSYVQVDDLSTIAPTTIVALGNATAAARVTRRAALTLDNPPYVVSAASTAASAGPQGHSASTFSALQQSLPPNVHLLSLKADALAAQVRRAEPAPTTDALSTARGLADPNATSGDGGDGESVSLLVRLMNFMEAGEEGALPAPSVDLRALFNDDVFMFESARPLLLSGNEATSHHSAAANAASCGNASHAVVTLAPTQIATCLLQGRRRVP